MRLISTDSTKNVTSNSVTFTVNIGSFLEKKDDETVDKRDETKAGFIKKKL